MRSIRRFVFGLLPLLALPVLACSSSSSQEGGVCDAACVVPDICRACDGGGYQCATSSCVNGQCVTGWGECQTGTPPDGGASTDGGTGSDAGDCGGGCVAPSLCMACDGGGYSCATATCVNGQCVSGMSPCK